MNSSEASERYEAERPYYERLATKIRALLEEILDGERIRAECESRTKTVESFREKIDRPGKAYNDPLAEISDLAGVRIVLDSLADVERVAKIINREFEVDTARSVNKGDQLDPDRFGYLSQHFIVRLNASRAGLSEWRGLGDRWAEVQVRTILQHAWAVIQHSLDYKSTTDIPRKLRRRLFRVSALLELADEELDALGIDIARTITEYREKLAHGNARIELNVDSLRTYVETSPSVEYWNQFLRQSIGHKIESWGDLSRDIRFAHFVGLSTIEDVDRLLQDAKGWGEEFFRRFFAEFFARTGSTPEQATTVVHGAATMLMIGAHAEAFSAEVLEKEFGFGSDYILDAARAARAGISTPTPSDR